MRLSFLVLPMLVGAAVAQHAPATDHRRHHARLAVRADTNGTDSAATGAGDDTAVTTSPQAQVVTSAKDTGVTTSPDAAVKTTANNAATTAKTTQAQNVETDTEAAVAVTSDKVTSAVVASTTALSSVVTSAVTSTSAVVATSATPVTSDVAAVTSSRTFADTTASHTSTKVTLVVTTKGTSTVTASAAAASSSSSSGGLAKGALIAIIIVASVIGAAAVGWTLFRKWKLRPSNRFDSRMQPIDFSPGGAGDMHDDFIEKTLQRSASVTSADRQRQEFVKDLDNGHSLTQGIPDHDFTAGAAGAGLAYGHYDPDPYEHGSYRTDAPYDFSSPTHSNGNNNSGYDYPAAPQQAATGYSSQHQYYNEHPTQDHSLSVDGHSSGDGYANVQRGPSGSSPPSLMPLRAQAPFDPLAGADFSVDGRPTGGTLGEQGPYAQAATYRY